MKAVIMSDFTMESYLTQSDRIIRVTIMLCMVMSMADSPEDKRK
jgi:hypothetical protein